MKTIYLKLCRPMDIPGDELLMSDVGTLTISLSKLCELKKKEKKATQEASELVCSVVMCSYVVSAVRFPGQLAGWYGGMARKRYTDF